MVVFLLSQLCALADSARSLIERGNAAYRAGSFDEALTRCEEATVDAPESALIYFNKGAALYKKEDYASAIEAFEQAALKSKKPRLGSRSRFNLGNCSFREAEKQRDSDLQKALEGCQKSIQHYQESLQLDPEYKQAAENIEVVRLVMKSILDEIKKQQEEQQQQQDAMQEIAKKLQELIAKQEGMVQQNQQITDEKKQTGDTQVLDDRTQNLAIDQLGVQNETSDLSGEMGQMEAQMQQQNPGSSGAASPQQPPIPTPHSAEDSPLSQAIEHVNTAVTDQGSAVEKLEENAVPSAKPYQEKAVEELKEALAKLSQKDDQNQQEEQQGDQENQEEQQQDSESDQNQQQEQKPPEDKDSEQQKEQEDARNILDEEKENRERRQPRQPLRYRAVEKDW